MILEACSLYNESMTVIPVLEECADWKANEANTIVPTWQYGDYLYSMTEEEARNAWDLIWIDDSLSMCQLNGKNEIVNLLCEEIFVLDESIISLPVICQTSSCNPYSCNAEDIVTLYSVFVRI